MRRWPPAGHAICCHSGVASVNSRASRLRWMQNSFDMRAAHLPLLPAGWRQCSSNAESHYFSNANPWLSLHYVPIFVNKTYFCDQGTLIRSEKRFCLGLDYRFKCLMCSLLVFICRPISPMYTWPQEFHRLLSPPILLCRIFLASIWIFINWLVYWL